MVEPFCGLGPLVAQRLVVRLCGWIWGIGHFNRERGTHVETIMGDSNLPRTFGASHTAPRSARPGGADKRRVRDDHWRMRQLALLQREYRSLLDQMQAAIDRLENGTYGNCQSCGHPISVDRLEAYPAATLCLSCKLRNEY